MPISRARRRMRAAGMPVMLSAHSGVYCCEALAQELEGRV